MGADGVRTQVSGETNQAAKRGPADGVGPQGGTAIRLMLVDDHKLVRDGVRALLGPLERIEVVGEADSVPTAVAQAERCRPDVVVMDIQLANGSGIEATREIRTRRPATKVLMLTSFVDEEAVLASIMAGASGYVLKQIDAAELVRAVLAVAEGHSLLDPTVTAAVLERVRSHQRGAKDDKLARLSEQEERVLALLGRGHTNKQIATELHLAEKTVKNYVSAILAKLEVARRSEAAVYVARRGSALGF